MLKTPGVFQLVKSSKDLTNLNFSITAEWLVISMEITSIAQLETRQAPSSGQSTSV